MDYLEKNLVELIRNRKEFFGSNDIYLSFRQIAEAWDEKEVIIAHQREVIDLIPRTAAINPTYKTVEEITDIGFISKVTDELKRLEDKKVMSLKTDLNSIFSPKADDKIYLEANKNFNKLFPIKKTMMSRTGGDYMLPPETPWDAVEIKFKDKLSVEILVNNRLYKKGSFEELGFYSGTNDKKPDRQWIFLWLLSTLQGKNGLEAKKGDMVVSLKNEFDKKISENNCDQIKSSLSEALEEIFGIEKPFYPYKERDCYKTRFTLTPEPVMRHEDPFAKERKPLREEYDYGGKAEEKHKEYLKSKGLDGGLGDEDNGFGNEIDDEGSEEYDGFTID